MTLNDAIRTLDATSTIAGMSEQTLVADVIAHQLALVTANPGMPQKTSIAPAQGLDGDLEVRPIEAMLELARGTALNNDPEITAVARWWPVLRYLGIFARHPKTRFLRLDGAALPFVGPNQRRVLSEDLGIGIGIIAAKMWCRARNPAIGPITAIDVDQALHNQAVPNLQRKGQRQPDYLLSYPDSARPGVMVYELLETKGTVSHANAKAQLGRATTQLAGLTVGGRGMTGVAISTVSNKLGITVMAVDPEEPPMTWVRSEAKLERWRSAEQRTRRNAWKLDVGADEFFATATNVDNASLAEYSGQHAAAMMWLPGRGQRGAHRTNAEARRETELGTFVGTEYVIDVSGTGHRVRLFQGAEMRVAEQLRGLDAVAVVEAQQSFARTERDHGASGPTGSNDAEEGSATAVSSDGSILEISVD